MKVNRNENKTIKTQNYEGGPAYDLSPKAKLTQMTCSCLFKEPKFYGTPSDIHKEIIQTAKDVAEQEPLFLLKLASYLRKEQYLRSISNFLLVFSANQPQFKGTNYIHQYAPKIIQRADEIKEVLAMQTEIFGKPVPNGLKKGVKDAFLNFDTYQFSKYNRKNAKEVVTFKDAIMLTHPKEPSNIISDILDDNLKPPKTWETQISLHGNKPEVWHDLIDSRKLPYMATLRNLRNLLTTGEDDQGIDDEHLDAVLSYITNEKAVKNSKQFPFRFLSAYRQLEDIPHERLSEVLDALEEAMYISYSNIPHLPGTTLLSCDVSGSMNWDTISRNSKILPMDIGVMMSMATHKYTDKAITSAFGTDFAIIQVPKRTSGIIKNAEKFIQDAQKVGWSTNGWKVIKHLNDNRKYVDRIMIFTDEQLYDDRGSLFHQGQHSIQNEWHKYQKEINPHAKLYIFDLSGYGTALFPEHDRSVAIINGWSNKVFNFIKTEETKPNAQVKYIEDNY